MNQAHRTLPPPRAALALLALLLVAFGRPDGDDTQAPAYGILAVVRGERIGLGLAR